MGNAVAIVEGAALVVLALVFAQALARQSRAHARREDLMLNQLLHAVGKPWQPAPADDDQPAPPEPRRYTASPEQHLTP